MKALDLAAINLSAPYSVWQESERDYLFRTDFGLVYKIGFMDDDTIWPSGAYQFLIINKDFFKLGIIFSIFNFFFFCKFF